MNIELHHQPSATSARITFVPGEQLTAESGSMIAMSSHLSMQTSTHKKSQGSILKAVKRLFAGESFFLNHYSASAPSELWLSTPLPGDLTIKTLTKGSRFIVQSGSFLAAEPSVQIEVGWQGFKSMFSGEGLFWLKVGGEGQMILSSFGAIYEIDVQDSYIVDTGHIVAFEDTLNFTLSKAGGSWIHSILGGEGIVCKFKGRGKLYCQSHNPASFGGELTPHLRPRKG
jgi:uncharacterized protein (TIGR00266 family)